MKKTFKNRFIILSAVLFFVILLGILNGSAVIPLSQIFLEHNRQILFLRLARVFLSLVAGSGLAVAGITLQAILRNPLAEPYILGTSSGAGLGAVAGIMLGLSRVYTPLTAFAGAILSVFLVYNIAREDNKIPERSLILSGVIVSIALSAIIVFFVSISSHEAIHGLIWWLWGSLQVYDIKLLIIVSLTVISGIALIYIFSQDLNAISLGEDEAVHLGIEVEHLKKILFLITALITASLVSICGIIGFVGLIIPHMTRFLVGPNHKVLIPYSCLGAAIFMTVCDLVSRTVFPSVEIPIGVITALFGAPLFIVLLKKRQRAK
jgi:iron complex transport system permease protein